MESTTKDRRVFGIAMAIFLGAIGVWRLIAGHSTAGTILVAVASAFLVAALAAPVLLGPILVPWRLFGMAAGYVMTRIILTVFYFLVITPFALVRRVLGKDSLERSLDGGASTWWRERDGGPPPRERYERQF